MRRLLCGLLLAAACAPAATYYVTIAGLGGEPDYEQHFEMWASDIEKVLKGSGSDAKIETLKGAAATRTAISALLGRIAGEATAQDVLVVMLIGHGTYDGVDYKINLPGPDLSAADLAKLLDKIRASRQLVVNMTSASGGSIEALKHQNRVLITATKTGTEKNATVFTRYWLEALGDAAADTDKNDTISALEAFRYAQQKTANFYETQKRIATEHAVIEDTGAGPAVRTPSAENGNGLRAASFPLVRLGSAQAAASDPNKRKLLDKKEELEQQIDKLKYEKAALPADEYKKSLGELLLELAKTQEELDK